MPDSVQIRRELRPEDPEAIVAQHRRLYSREQGVDEDFVAMVDAAVAAAVEGDWPKANEGLWVVERDGEFAGSVALTDDGDGVAVLRWFLLEPELRGRGLGRCMVEEVLEKAEASGYARVRLETFSDLRAAARLYRTHGFELTGADSRPRWGREQITYQHYVLELPRRQQNATVAGATARI
jgi:RimJ/RimL family protein N-acetyltransferase